MQESEKSRNDGGAVFSKEDTLASVEGDRELLLEVVGIFMDECPTSVAAIRKALDERDASGLDRSAHTLKGMVGNFGACACMERALRLEKMGKSSDFTNAREAFATLEEELERLKNALEQFAGEAQDENTYSRG